VPGSEVKLQPKGTLYSDLTTTAPDHLRLVACSNLNPAGSSTPCSDMALCPVLVNHPLRHLHLYAIYVSGKHLPLKTRTFIDQLVEFTHIPLPWDDPVTHRRQQ
jgi:hypothetical protein